MGTFGNGLSFHGEASLRVDFWFFRTIEGMKWFLPICILLLTSCSSNPEPVLPEKQSIETTGKIDINYFNKILYEEGVEVWSNALLFKEKNGDNKTFSGEDLELVLSKASCYDDTSFEYGLCYRKLLTDSNVTRYEGLLEENLDVKINALIGEDYLELSTSGLLEINNCFKVSPGSNLDIGNGIFLNDIKYIEGGCS